MLVYLDTSALVKLYIEEAHSEQIAALCEQAETIASQQIAFVEFHAAIARRHRDGDVDNEQFEAYKQEFAKDRIDYLHVNTDHELMQSASELAEAFALRAYDSVHLAAARHLQHYGKLSVMFACFDKRLNLAAKTLGMQTIRTD